MTKITLSKFDAAVWKITQDLTGLKSEKETVPPQFIGTLATIQMIRRELFPESRPATGRT